MTDTDSGHAIGRQIWEVMVGSEPVALTLRPHFGDWNRRLWLPRLEAVLDALDRPDLRLRIAHLDLDLGVVVLPSLGKPSLKALEQTIGDRLVEHLRRELQRRVDTASAAVPADRRSALDVDLEMRSETEARLELFEYVLLRGRLPFWAPRRGFRFADLLQRLGESIPKEVAAVIRRHGHRQRVLRRLVAQLDRQAFYGLLQLLEPEHATLLVAYLLDIGRLHRKQPLIPLGARRLERSLALLTLAYLVNERGSRFNRKSYVRALIRSLARAQGLLYDDLLRSFGRCLAKVISKPQAERSRSLLRSSLPDLLRELLAELDGNALATGRVGDGGRPLERLRSELLEYLPAVTGSSVAGNGKSAASPLGLGAMLVALAEHHPPSARSFLESLRLRRAERRAVARESGMEAFDRMLEILVPDDAGSLSELVGALGRVPAPYRPRSAEVREAVLAEILRAGSGRPVGEDVLARILRRLFESPLPEPVARSLDREIHRVPARLPDAPRAALRRAVARAAGHDTDGSIATLTGSPEIEERGPIAATEPSSRHRRRGAGGADPPVGRRPSGSYGTRVIEPPQAEAGLGTESAAAAADDTQGDEPLYLDNAGLVLIGPFLPRLLEQLEVLADGEVRDLDSASRAVHLLQYLVDGRLDASEPELVLPKVLCGWSVAEPVSAELEPDPTHLVLCDGLLASIAERWPSFRGSSVAALRETFLQRQGRLVSAEVEHRLEVERATVDVLMSDLPWGFSLILHDAMDRPLVVTW